MTRPYSWGLNGPRSISATFQIMVAFSAMFVPTTLIFSLLMGTSDVCTDYIFPKYSIPYFDGICKELLRAGYKVKSVWAACGGGMGSQSRQDWCNPVETD